MRRDPLLSTRTLLAVPALALLSILTLGLPSQGSLGQASLSQRLLGTGVAFADGKTEFTLYHVGGTSAEKVTVPKPLARFKKRLLKTGHKKFQTLGAAKTIQLEVDKPQTIEIPGKLGKVKLTLDKNGRVVVAVLNPKNKSIGTVAARFFPVVLLNDKVKTTAGDYILVLDKKKKE